MQLPLEDDFNDVIGKAQKGQEITTEMLAEKANLHPSRIRAIRRGKFDASDVETIGKSLGLNVPALMDLGRNMWKPAQLEPVEGFTMISTPFYDWTVNAFLAWNPQTKKAIAFDTGTDAGPMIDFLKGNGLWLDALILTHTHWDHVKGVGALQEEMGVRVFVDEREPDCPEGAERLSGDFSMSLDGLSIRSIETTGHSQGGRTYVVEGLQKPVAVVGDALFAGSMGGPAVSYQESLRGLSRILGLPVETQLGPGHGPMSTVAQERVHNCFSAYRQRG